MLEPAADGALVAASTRFVEPPPMTPELETAIWALGLLLVGVLVLVTADRAVAALRVALRRRRESRVVPGSTPLQPLHVLSFHEVDGHKAVTCQCAGQPKVVFEGATSSKERRLWLVIQMCPDCDKRLQTYYDVTEATDAQPLVANAATPAPR